MFMRKSSFPVHIEEHAGGHLMALIDHVGSETDFSYDLDGHQTSMTDPLHYTATYAYDADGRRSPQTDRDGRRRDFSYDGNSRLLEETWFDVDGVTVVDKLSSSYDENGNLVEAKNN